MSLGKRACGSTRPVEPIKPWSALPAQQVLLNMIMPNAAAKTANFLMHMALSPDGCNLTYSVLGRQLFTAAAGEPLSSAISPSPSISGPRYSSYFFHRLTELL